MSEPSSPYQGAAQSPLVVIIILSWDSLRDTLTCLQAARHSDYPNFEILVVDNANQPELAKVLQRDYPEVYLLQNPTNLGYAAGHNRGIGWALEQGAAWVLLLNDDITIEPNTCRLLADLAAQDPAVAAVGGKIRPLGQPKMLWAAGEPFPREAPLREDKGQFDSQRPVHYVVGCCILLSRTALEKVGLFDEAFFMLHEEKDWCKRAFRAGLMVWYIPDAVAWHDLKDTLTHAGSTTFHYLNVRNNLYFWQKYTSNIIARRRRRQVIDLTWQEIKFIFRHGKQPLRRTWAAIRGARDFLTGRLGPPPQGL